MDCYTGDGSSYVGHVNKTVKGIDCQAWAMQVPHGHGHKDDQLPENSLEKAKNYCRNPKPTTSPGPWCYTMDEKIRSRLCNVETCGE